MTHRTLVCALSSGTIIAVIIITVFTHTAVTSSPSAGPHSSLGSVPATPRVVSVPAPTSALAAKCAAAPGWSCDQWLRFAAAQRYLAGRPGTLGIVVRDRTSSATWRAGDPTHVTWTASTIKVALATALLEQHRAGEIQLDETDRANLHASLINSSNAATTALWDRYADKTMIDRFRTRYAMTTLSVVPGYNLFWRHLQCSAEDLFNLMSYVLTGTHPEDRAHLVKELRSVSSNQRWGVWAAGPALQPGNKNGWAQKPDNTGTHWVTHSVGFAGREERYVVAVTYSLPPSGAMSDGIHAISDLVATIFGGSTPAPVSLP